MPLRPRPACLACGRLTGCRCVRRDRSGDLTQPGYGAGWRALRAEHLAMEPWCRECLTHGRYVAATDVDHITARRKGGSEEHDNLRSLCHACHARKTAAEDGGFGNRRTGDHLAGNGSGRLAQEGACRTSHAPAVGNIGGAR
jgi:5-methylcytosine-specific restriction endonuclease McrA